MSQPLPRITLITPSFNQAAFLEATIRSVLDQQYPNLQYGVVDGDSTDGSADIIENFRDRLDFAIVEPDRGQVDALNKGLRRADGQIIGFINSDDTLLPGCLHAVADHFSRRPDSRWVIGDCTVIDHAGEPIETVISTPVRDLAHALIRDERFNIPQPSIFWRRELTDRLGLFLEEYEYCFDYEMWCRFLRHGVALDKIDAPLATYRLHESSKTCALRDRQTADHIRIEQLYARYLPIAQRLRLARRIGYRRRQLAAKAPGAPLRRQVLRRPWWLLSAQVRQSLTVQ